MAVSTLDDRRAARRRREKPITIVGAGPAGLASAIALARSGRRVVVKEWHATVGHRFHGDFQGLENWSSDQNVLNELTANGIAPTFDHLAVFQVTLFDSRGAAYPIQSARPLYYLVRRGAAHSTLDHALLEQAIAAGVDVHFAERVETIEQPAVLAGGPRVADAIAVGYVFETDMSDGDYCVLDNRLAPLGYAYLLVHGGRGTVASCMFTGFKQQEEHVARTISFFQDKVGLAMRNPQRFGGFANFRLPRTGVQGGHLVIGEQAGFQDALAGFGMRYALRSGLLAARSIIDGTDYTSLWRRELLPLLRAGTVNRFLFNVVGEGGRRLALRALSAGDAGLVLRRFYLPSFARRLLFPLARVRYRAPLRDRSCDHKDCPCVWCEHGTEPPPTACAESDRVISPRRST
jgi:flavin-dependent dehydrogenase